MLDIILVGLGGFLGAVLRYVMSGWLQKSFSAVPIGTLGVNILGSFLLGFFMFLGDSGGLFTEEQRVFFAIGVLGAFTTMSTFSFETFKLLEQGETLLFAANITATITLTLTAVFIGRTIALTFWRPG